VTVLVADPVFAFVQGSLSAPMLLNPLHHVVNIQPELHVFGDQFSAGVNTLDHCRLLDASYAVVMS
jgi:hypothetical protein